MQEFMFILNKQSFILVCKGDHGYGGWWSFGGVGGKGSNESCLTFLNYQDWLVWNKIIVLVVSTGYKGILAFCTGQQT